MSARARAVAGSLLFLAVAPGVMAGLVPYLLTGWDPADPSPAARIAGAALILIGERRTATPPAPAPAPAEPRVAVPA